MGNGATYQPKDLTHILRADEIDFVNAPTVGQQQGHFGTPLLSLNNNQTPTFSVNQSRGFRCRAGVSGILHDLSVYISTPDAAGSLDVGVYDTGDLSNGNRTALYRLGGVSMASMAVAGWYVLADPLLKVVQGVEYDVVIATTSTTVLFMRHGAVSGTASQLPPNFNPVPGGATPILMWQKGTSYPLPASYTDGGLSPSTSVPAVMGRIAPN